MSTFPLYCSASFLVYVASHLQAQDLSATSILFIRKARSCFLRETQDKPDMTGLAISKGKILQAGIYGLQAPQSNACYHRMRARKAANGHI